MEKNEKTMKYAINLNSILPIRAESSERSEMVTQLLFGEICEVLDSKNTFVKIKNAQDGYVGWADAKMLERLSNEEYCKLEKDNSFRVLEVVADVFCLSNKTIYRLPMGSLLPNYNTDSSKFEVAGLAFQIHPDFVTYLPSSNKDGVVPVAKTFLNSPYLWGGKSLMGIDCSGFVQTVFSVNGFSLPRDASQQVSEGVAITLEEALPGDLLFFAKADRITHVGIYCGNERIIHASGRVRLDKIDDTGVYNDEISDYTHYLSAIRRIE